MGFLRKIKNLFGNSKKLDSIELNLEKKNKRKPMRNKFTIDFNEKYEFSPISQTTILENWRKTEEDVYEGEFRANGESWEGFAVKQGPYYVIYIKNLEQEILDSKHGKCFFETTGKENWWRIHVQGENSIEGYPESLVGGVREVERYLKEFKGENR